MSSSIEEEESLEHTLLVVREVSIFKIPPRSFSGGYKCGEWLQSGELFAACFVLPGQRENSVETVLDSSRYFVLKIEDGRGKHAFIGLWFNERNEAFDFNVALSDQEKHVKRETDKDGAGDSDKDGGNHIDIHPAVNHRLKTSLRSRPALSFTSPRLRVSEAVGRDGGSCTTSAWV
ncbi:hypothetical protein ACHQM5_002542 [Ranunculus cassubicifolius]